MLLDVDPVCPNPPPVAILVGDFGWQLQSDTSSPFGSGAWLLERAVLLCVWTDGCWGSPELSAEPCWDGVWPSHAGAVGDARGTRLMEQISAAVKAWGVFQCP